ncbi:MAG: glycosyltransferase [Oscillospiraceae bacterium]|nr:glycosyltransferase [Oscillospiraceae bacterium]
MNIVLYDMRLPDVSIPDAIPDTLYIRTKGTVIRNANNLQMTYDSILSFDTWFGCFDYMQWRKNTIVTTPIACFQIKGTMLVQCLIYTENGVSMLYEQTVTGDGIHPQVFPFSLSNLPENGFLYFQLQAKSKVCQFLRGYYLADVPACSSVQLAAVICTHQREEWISRTIQQLFEWQTTHHPLPLTVFLIDNGQTWTKEKLPQNEQIRLFHNQNTGGSGGFTRGIQEALQEKENTHILLMDDDIIADWNGIARTIAFLSVCKPELQETLTVGGTMMDIMQPSIQFEAGAFCKNRCLTGLQSQADLTDVNALLARMTPFPTNYAAWWACFLPVAAVKKAGLPMPFFIKMDDVEYALQMHQTVVMMTGVCVWHENFYLKYAPWNEYYITRNGSITYAMHGQAGTSLSVAKELWHTVLRLLLLYRYDTADFVLQGYRDFLRGWSWLAKTNAIQLHQTLLQQQNSGTEQFSIDSKNIPTNIPQISFFHATTKDCKKQKAVFLFHPFTKKGMLATRNNRRFFRALWHMIGISIQMVFTYRRTVRGYQKHRETLCSDTAWHNRNGEKIIK